MFSHRVLLTVAVLAGALLFLFLVGRVVDLGAQQRRDENIYEGVPLDATLLLLDKRALEEAYHQQLIKLFSIWLTNSGGTDVGPITNGLRNARRAYNLAASQIARREQQLLELDRKQHQDNP